MTDTQSLIARLEALDGPSYAIENDIHRSLGYLIYQHCPRYTASVDDALTLVSEKADLRAVIFFALGAVPDDPTQDQIARAIAAAALRAREAE